MDIFNHKHHKALLMRILVPLILAPLSLMLKFIGATHGVLSAAAVLLLIATPPSPPRTTPLFSNSTLFVICYALCAAYLSASAAEILSVCAVLIAAGYISAKIRMQMESEHRKNISSAEHTARLNELNALLLAAHSTDEILDLVLGFMHRVSGRSIILFETSRSIRRISAAPQGVIIYSLDTAAITQAAKTQRKRRRLWTWLGIGGIALVVVVIVVAVLLSSTASSAPSLPGSDDGDSASSMVDIFRKKETTIPRISGEEGVKLSCQDPSGQELTIQQVYAKVNPSVVAVVAVQTWHRQVVRTRQASRMHWKLV